MVQIRIARLATMAALIVGLVVGARTVAQEATPEVQVALPPLPEGCEVVADDLLGPRFVAVADDGTLYVTETGTGGDEVIPPPPIEGGAATPMPAEEEAPPATRGYTGQVTVVAPDGTQALLSTNFASYSNSIGPHGITIGPDGLIYMTVGGPGIAAGLEPLTGEDTVFVIDPATGQPTPLAEIASYEAANNPDGTDVNSNLYGLEFGDDGLLYVADAGGNVIYQVNPATGEFVVFAVVPGLSALTGATPEADAEDRQPVPTDLVLLPDGALQITLLSQEWPADAPSILRLETDGSFTPVASGLTMAVAQTIGPDGATYVTQLWTSFGPEGPGLGNIVRVDADGSTEVVLDDLFLPHGTAFDADGNLYVATGSVFPAAPTGQVLRCEGIGGEADGTPAAAGAAGGLAAVAVRGA
jgi:hypothetical protein